MALSKVSKCALQDFAHYQCWQPTKMNLLSFSQLHLLNTIFVFSVCVCTHVQKVLPNVLVDTLISPVVWHQIEFFIFSGNLFVKCSSLMSDQSLEMIHVYYCLDTFQDMAQVLLFWSEPFFRGATSRNSHAQNIVGLLQVLVE